MNQYIISVASRTTGEVTEIFAKSHCLTKKADGTLEYIKLYHNYIDKYGNHKDEIEIYPEFKLVAVTTYTEDEYSPVFVKTTGIPELYDLVGIYQQIV